MPTIEEQYKARFSELVAISNSLPRASFDHDFADSGAWSQWLTSALHLLELTYGKDSGAYISLTKVEADTPHFDQARRGFGILLAAKEDFDRGFSKSLSQSLSGEVLGDFVSLAKNALKEGHKDVAAVLACAALDDALKRYATANGLDVFGKTMDNVIGALKSKGLVQGAQKALLDPMPRIRNYALHADWTKIAEPEVNSVIGFVETFLQTKF